MAQSHDVSHESTTTTESHDADALADSWPQSESSKDISVTLDVDQSQLQHDDDHATTTSFEEMLERNLEGFGRVMFFQHSDICKLHASEWAWDEIPSKTIISEWGLQCSTALLRGLPASSHFAGTILGVFVLASLADSWLGRQKLKMMQITLSLASFLCADTAFNLILVYSVEMFPTCVRNFAASMARQAITFGAVLGALLNSFGRKNPYLSYGVFGLIIICCGFFVLILPETKGISLCDTMDEQEKKENIVHS
ncbi:hypothetical protein EZV62_025469 [Acer yangbiense]|uniref:Major facilitator superfamily (MFS) profile domain-containing protein n=1 Tax=Acer yangbiense TaxID=1000413 RepID=A0A5C7GXW1_9ROSI|nr:hypothetical protein EZV62_025469 [Acer yangbiense]